MTDEPDDVRLLLIEDSEDDAIVVVNEIRRAGLRIRQPVACRSAEQHRADSWSAHKVSAASEAKRAYWRSDVTPSRAARSGSATENTAVRL